MAAAASAAFSAVALLLGGCASPPSAPEGMKLAAAGRLSMRVEASPERPAQSMSAAFEWRGDGQRGELTLLSPLGMQVARAQWSPAGAMLQTPEGSAGFETLEALSERALGERVPLMAWPDWLAGRPWPGAPSAPRGGAAGTPGAADAGSTGGAASAVGAAAAPGFEQLGWDVDLTRHAEGRIEARRSAPPAVTVRIVLDEEFRRRP
jgi:outer membrane lipoprotein LolB